MAELDRGGHAELGEARHVLPGQKLRMLDARAKSSCLPEVTGLLEGVEGLPVRQIADRMHGDGKPGRRAAADVVRQLFLARDLDAGAVHEPRRLRAERP